jgi:hypothetical protein
MLKEILESMSYVYVTPKHLYPKGPNRNNYVEVTFEVGNKKYAILMINPVSTSRLTPSLEAQQNWKTLPKEFQKTASGTPLAEFTAEYRNWKKALEKRGAKNIDFDFSYTNKR